MFQVRGQGSENSGAGYASLVSPGLGVLGSSGPSQDALPQPQTESASAGGTSARSGPGHSVGRNEAVLTRAPWEAGPWEWVFSNKNIPIFYRLCTKQESRREMTGQVPTGTPWDV